MQKPINGNPRTRHRGSLGKDTPEIEVVPQDRRQKSKSGKNSLNVTTVGEIRRKSKSVKRKARAKQEKQEANAGIKSAKRSVRKSRIALVTALSLFILVIVGFASLQITGVFNIKNVEYVGAEHLTQAECEALAVKPVGESLLTFDSAKIEEGMKRTTWVESVSFERVFPDTLKIHVHERSIGAVVDFTTGAKQISQSWIITLDGMWIMAIPEQSSETGAQISQNIYTDAESAVHITDCPNGIAPQLGGSCTDTTVLNALAILRGMTTNLKDQVQSISVSSVSATTIKLNNNIEIAFGQADQIREKERIVNEIISQNSKVVYVNVRTVDRPTWRAA